MVVSPAGNVTGMTVKLVVPYIRPAGSDAFDRDYSATHMPLVDKIPGRSALRRRVSWPLLTQVSTPATGSPSCASPARGG